MSTSSNRLELLASQHGLRILQQLQTTLMSNLLTYKMESATLVIQSNGKWCHCHLMHN